MTLNNIALFKIIADKTGKVPQLVREVTEPVEVSRSTIRKILQMRNVRLYVWIYLTSFSYVIIKKKKLFLKAFDCTAHKKNPTNE